MTQVKLLNGPCDPRWVDMVVTPDAQTISVRPVPFDCYDVYAVVDKLVDGDKVTAAMGDYVYTDGARRQVDSYRKTILRLGTGRAFLVKRKPQARHVH